MQHPRFGGAAASLSVPPALADETERPGILILLTRYRDVRSLAGASFTCSWFTHASIGLASDPGRYYSFAYKGFRVELTDVLVERAPGTPCRIYWIPCTREEEQAIKCIATAFRRRKAELSFNLVGLLLASLDIPFVRKDAFFCSQFVATVLNRVCSIGSARWAQTCLPDELEALPQAELLFDGRAREFAGDGDDETSACCPRAQTLRKIYSITPVGGCPVSPVC